MVGPSYAGEALGLGMHADWRGSYDNTYLSDMKDFAPMIRMGMGTKTYVTPYGFPIGRPAPRHTDWGVRIATAPHRYLSFRVVQKRWTNGTEMLSRDIRYSQLGNLRDDMSTDGMLFASLPVRCAHQIMLATVDPELLPGISGYLCPDGGAIFSATDGASGNRNGIVGGNDLTGYDPTSGAGFRRATMAGITQIIRFRDPYNNQTLHSQRLALKNGVTVAFAPELLPVYQEAWVGSRVSSRADGGPGNAAISNAQAEDGYRVTPLCDPYLTDTSKIYVFVNNAPIPPMFELVGNDLQTGMFNGANSEDRFRTDSEAVLAQKEFGIGLNAALFHCRVGA